MQRETLLLFQSFSNFFLALFVRCHSFFIFMCGPRQALQKCVVGCVGCSFIQADLQPQLQWQYKCHRVLQRVEGSYWMRIHTCGFKHRNKKIMAKVSSWCSDEAIMLKTYQPKNKMWVTWARVLCKSCAALSSHRFFWSISSCELRTVYFIIIKHI